MLLNPSLTCGPFCGLGVMKQIEKLSARRVATVIKPGKYGDGLGLWLYVRSSGTKSWVYRYMRYGKAREMGLGSIHTLSLSEARDKAGQVRKLLLEGGDPIETNRKMKLAIKLSETTNPTYKKSAERFINTHKTGWKNKKHIAQWSSTHEKYVYKVFGDLSVQDIDTGLVLKVLEPIWNTKPETASRVRGRIERVLDWAKARGYREGENPARWRGHLENLLSTSSKARRVKHFAALPYQEIYEFMEALRKQVGISANALEFLILTAARSGEVRKANWKEIDLDLKLWVIPIERMKAAREHRVPLSGRAIVILNEMKKNHGQDGFVFPGAKRKSSLSNMSLSAVLRRMDHRDITVHGFRSTFRDWTAEQTSYPREVAELALAHSITNKVEAAYRRGDLIEKRQHLMGDWAAYCEQPQLEGDVVSIITKQNKK